MSDTPKRWLGVGWAPVLPGPTHLGIAKQGWLTPACGASNVNHWTKNTLVIADVTCENCLTWVRPQEQPRSR